MENKPFVFLVSKGWKSLWDRGGTQYAVQAYLEEFTNEDNVCMIVKINPAYGIPNIDEMIKQLIPKEKTNLPKIKIITQNYDYNKLPELYCLGDVFVCTTRAEAFDLGSAEAMSCNIPVVTTGYGGQIEHMNDKNSMVVNSVLEEQDKDILYEGILWATPEISDIRKKMRWCFENQDKVKEMGKNAKEFISANFTWEMSASKAMNFLNEL